MMWVKSWHTPFLVLEAGLDRRVHARALADVIEGPVDADVDIADEREWIAAVGAVDAKLPRQIVEQRRGAGEVARHQHRPEVALRDVALQHRPTNRAAAHPAAETADRG